MSGAYHRVVVATIPEILLTDPATLPRVPHGHDIPALVRQFATRMPVAYQPLLTGPIPHALHGGQTWFFSNTGCRGTDYPGDDLVPGEDYLVGGDVYTLQEQFIGIFDRPECFHMDVHWCSVIVLTWNDDASAIGRPTAHRRV